MSKKKEEKPSFDNDLIELLNMHNVVLNLHMIPDEMTGKHIIAGLVNREYMAKRKNFMKYDPKNQNFKS